MISDRDGDLRAGAQDGFALVFAIWAIGLLSVMIISLSASSRTRILETSAVLSLARAKAVSHSAIQIAMAELLRQRAAETAARVPETSGLQSRDGAPRRCAIGDDFNVEIRVFDEAGKIDINTAGPELVERFLSRVLPRDAASARFARQLIERRSAEAKRENPSSGGPATAKGSRSKPFGTTFELGRLPGATPDLLERSLPFVTVHSGLAGIDAEFAALDLLRSLADGENGRGSRAAIARSMPATYLTSSPKNVFLIRATADSAAGATHRAEAIIEIASPATPSIKTLEWREPHVDPSVPTPAFVRVAAC